MRTIYFVQTVQMMLTNPERSEEGQHIVNTFEYKETKGDNPYGYFISKN